jgi:hypothetical protein
MLMADVFNPSNGVLPSSELELLQILGRELQSLVNLGRISTGSNTGGSFSACFAPDSGCDGIGPLAGGSTLVEQFLWQLATIPFDHLSASTIIDRAVDRGAYL